MAITRRETNSNGRAYADGKPRWQVRLRHGDGTTSERSASAVLLAHGVLNRWSLPAIPGLERFKGPKMHTAGWDTSVDLKGKRVGYVRATTAHYFLSKQLAEAGLSFSDIQAINLSPSQPARAVVARNDPAASARRISCSTWPRSWNP